jgi:hypothetical protein
LAHDEDRHDWRAAAEAQERRPARHRHGAATEGDGHAIAAELPIPDDADQPPFPEPLQALVCRSSA